MRVLAMQMRRELWEHRSLWIAPLLVAILLLGGVATLGRIQLYEGPARPATANSPFELMLLGWGIPFYLAAGIVVVVYLLDCLYGERRDRSILFWRSLPVSDTETVLAKLLVGLVVVPYATFLLAAATSVLASAILALRHVVVNGQVAPLWDTLTWLRMQAVMLYGLTVLLLWYAPYATYLMLASAWARRSPYAWAFVPPVLLAMGENMVFGTNYLGRIVERGFNQMLRLFFNLNEQLAYSIGDAIPTPHRPGVVRPPAGGGATDLLTSPQLWLGLIAAALMLLLAIRLRRYRDDS